MPFVAAEITLSELIKNILGKYSRSRTLPLSQVQRSMIVLLAEQGKNNREIGELVSLSQDAVSRWRTRWINNSELFTIVEQNNPEDLEETITNFLKDLPRPGCPCNFNEEQIIKILELACHNPTEYGYESSHWSTTQLADIVVKQGIVESISPASINRFLKYGGYSSSQNTLLASFHRKGR